MQTTIFICMDTKIPSRESRKNEKKAIQENTHSVPIHNRMAHKEKRSSLTSWMLHKQETLCSLSRSVCVSASIQRALENNEHCLVFVAQMCALYLTFWEVVYIHWVILFVLLPNVVAVAVFFPVHIIGYWVFCVVLRFIVILSVLQCFVGGAEHSASRCWCMFQWNFRNFRRRLHHKCAAPLMPEAFRWATVFVFLFVVYL